MVKCNNCGVEVDDAFDLCPNCGSNLNVSSEKIIEDDLGEIKCSKCGKTLPEGVLFCPDCGTEVESQNSSNKCKKCGAELPENVLFCPNCGEKATQAKKNKTCPNCGTILSVDASFCDECGTNLVTGEVAKVSPINSNQSFVDKIDLNSIIKPSVFAVIIAIVLSSIGLLIGFSWISFIIAIILSVGFFAGLVDNEANAVVMGLFVGLILGILENPLVEFWFGSIVAGLYDWFFGGQMIILIILGVICAYVSNIYLKENIRNIAGSFADNF